MDSARQRREKLLSQFEVLSDCQTVHTQYKLLKQTLMQNPLTYYKTKINSDIFHASRNRRTIESYSIMNQAQYGKNSRYGGDAAGN